MRLFTTDGGYPLEPTKSRELTAMNPSTAVGWRQDLGQLVKSRTNPNVGSVDNDDTEQIKLIWASSFRVNEQTRRKGPVQSKQENLAEWPKTA